MSHVPNDLHDIFSADADLLHRLKLEDSHFQRLAARHHDLNREIHRIESDIEPASDDVLEALKKDRLALLDEVAQIIAKAKASA